MAKKGNKAATTPPKADGLAIPPDSAGDIRESFSKAQEAGIEHHQLRRVFVVQEKQALEREALYEREFNRHVEAAATALGIDPAQHTVNLQTMRFEKRK